MPEKSQTITVAGYDAARLQAIAYGALQQLVWTIKYAGDNILLAYTPKSWNKYADEITIVTEDNRFTVTSKMIHGEIIDMMGRNKKHIAEFLAAFETVKAKATDLNTGEWSEKIELLKGDTIKIAEQEIKQAEEVDKVMNLSKANLYVTYAIIAVNVLVFVAMLLNGVSIMTPTVGELIKWGANHPQLTPSGEWWRLITCVFVHIGIIHLLLNMYALYSVGVYLEPMLGKLRYISAYLCAGILASLVSLLWNKNTEITSAGASGAIFGMYGFFLAFLTTNLIPKQVRNTLLQSILIFVAYNIFYGLKPNSGIGNSAHIGGLVSGMIIGYIYYFTLKKPISERKTNSIVGFVSLATIMLVFIALRNSSGNQDMKFIIKYDEVVDLQNKAMAPLKNDQLSDSEKAVEIEKISLPTWQQAAKIMKGTASYNLSAERQEKRSLMTEYVDLRIEIMETLLKAYKEHTNEYEDKLNSIGQKIDAVLKKLNKME